MNPTCQECSGFFFVGGGGGGGGGDGQGYYGGLKGTWDFWTKAELKGDREGRIWRTREKGKEFSSLAP